MAWVFIHTPTYAHIHTAQHSFLRRGVMAIATAQLHSTKPEFRFCAGSNPARSVSEIHDGEKIL